MKQFYPVLRGLLDDSTPTSTEYTGFTGWFEVHKNCVNCLHSNRSQPSWLIMKKKLSSSIIKPPSEQNCWKTVFKKLVETVQKLFQVAHRGPTSYWRHFMLFCSFLKFSTMCCFKNRSPYYIKLHWTVLTRFTLKYKCQKFSQPH